MNQRVLNKSSKDHNKTIIYYVVLAYVLRKAKLL